MDIAGNAPYHWGCEAGRVGQMDIAANTPCHWGCEAGRARQMDIVGMLHITADVRRGGRITGIATLVANLSGGL